MPRQHNLSPEARAKLSAAMKARWAADREIMLAQSRKGGVMSALARPSRPAPGTEARRVFEKIRRESNAAAAHAELARRPC